MIYITPGRVARYLILGGIIPGIALFFYLTRYNFVPVQITLGSCEMDYTNSASYSDRVSPLKSEELEVLGWEMLLCYGQPSTNGRKIMGDIVAYDQLWRFGANEPTRFYTKADVNMGGILLPKGRYSLYAKPEKYKWEIFINRSISHWGNDFSAKVREKEIGSFIIPVEYMEQSREQLTFKKERVSSRNVGEPSREIHLVYMWEHTKLTIPITILERDDKSEKSIQEEIKQKSKELKEVDTETDTSTDD